MSDDLPSVYRDDQVIARKSHRCCECKRTIHKGEEYNRYTGCWDGKWDAYITCAECDALRRELASEDGPLFGDLSEWAYEAGIEFPINRTIPDTTIGKQAATG